MLPPSGGSRKGSSTEETAVEIEARQTQHKTAEGARVTRIVGWNQTTGARIEHIITWTELTLEPASREQVIA